MSLPSCPRCGAADVISITNQDAEGGPIAFYSCHTCDKRWWSQDGEPIALAEVLERAKREPRRAGRAS